MWYRACDFCLLNIDIGLNGNKGKLFLSTSGDRMIHHWDLRTMSCFHKGVDEVCITGIAISTSPNDDLFSYYLIIDIMFLFSVSLNVFICFLIHVKNFCLS